MAGRKIGADLVEQALKLIMGGAENTAKKSSYYGFGDRLLPRASYEKYFPPGSPEYERNLRNWAKNSKLVDDAGSPIRLYHQTPEYFDIFQLPNEPGERSSGPGIWMTDNPKDIPSAHNTSGPRNSGQTYREGTNIMPVYARMKNPLVIDASNEETVKSIRNQFSGGSSQFPHLLTNEWREKLLQAGHDGIVFKNRDNLPSEYIALDPADVKSAIGNRGTFYSNNPRLDKANGGEVDAREGYGPGGEIVEQALKLVMGESDNVTRLSDVKSARERDALIKQIKSTINLVKSGYSQAGRQALINQKSLDLHKSGMLPLQQGTIVTPPSTWDMPGDWRVSGYWYDEKDPRRFGYKIQNESGQTYDAVASDPRAGLRHNNPYSFGGGFKAYAGPNAAPPKPIVSPVEKPAIAPRPPEVLDAINKEYEDLFGNEDLFKPKAHGGRTGYGPGGVIDDIVEMAGKIVSGADEPAKTGIRAYQGSPHDFAAERLVRFPDKTEQYIVGTPDVLPDVPEGAEVIQDFPLGRMRMDKIGTGEGAQAYSHGLYAAEAEDVAQGYRQRLANVDASEADKIGIPPNYWNAFTMFAKQADETQAEAAARDFANWTGLGFTPDLVRAFDNTLKSRGRMYEVNINADPNQFLDWDKPLSEHPQDVRDALQKYYGFSYPSKEQQGWTGKDVAQFSTMQPEHMKRFYEETKIPGIRYFDAGSRPHDDVIAAINQYGGKDQAIAGLNAILKGTPSLAEESKAMFVLKELEKPVTRNYVVFDDKLISIIRKYGIAGASAMLGYNLMDGLGPDQAKAAIAADQEYKSSGQKTGGMLPFGMEPSGELTSRTPSASERLYDYVREHLLGDEDTKGRRAETIMNVLDQTPATIPLVAYDIGRSIVEAAYAKGGEVYEDDDINDALRIAKDNGGSTGSVFMTDAKGINYDINGNIIPPEVTGPNPARSEATPEQVGQRAAQDPATFDALMQKYAVPDQDIARYEATKAAVAKQPYETQQMTHVGAPPMRDVKVDMPLLGGEKKITQAPYNVAGPMSMAAQAAYDLKTVPLYFTPFTAPIGAGLDVAEGVATGDPLQASMAALGAPGKMAKGAIIGLSNYAMDPAEAQAGKERFFSKLLKTAEELPMEKMTGQQALAMLRKGVSPEELKWTGADRVFNTPDQITKKELVDYLEKNRVTTEDIFLADRSQKYPYKSAEGWQNAIARAERARNFDEAERLTLAWEEYEGLGGFKSPRYRRHSTSGGEDYKETLITLPTNEYGKLFQSGHWEGYPNVIGHIRTQVLDVTPPGANRPYKAFNVDEAQSDYAKEGREIGFSSAEEISKREEEVRAVQKEREKYQLDLRAEGEKIAALEWEAEKQLGSFPPVSDRFARQQRIDEKRAMLNSNPDYMEAYSRHKELQQKNDELIREELRLSRNIKGVPSAPYVASTQNWTDLSVKKALDQAMDAGSDYFTYTPGKAQAARYSLRNAVDELHYSPSENRLYGRKDGRWVFDQKVEPDKLSKYVGSAVADELLKQPTKTSKWYATPRHVLSGQQLELGGEGMIDYYDNIYKRRVEKVVKDATGKKVEWEVITVNTADGPREQLGFRLTDEMREKARFSDFNKGGRVTGGNTYDNDSSVAHALALTSEY